MRQAAPIVVASYNIHRTIGMDGRRDPDRVAAVIISLGAEIVALQEVDGDGAGESAVERLQRLAARAGFLAVPGWTIKHGGKRFGNALLVRAPPLAVRGIDLSVPGREPRGAIDCDVRVREGAVLRVVATHLGLRPFERRQQVLRLLDTVAAAPDRPTLLLGDFNEWLAPARCLRWLYPRFGSPPAPPSWPARWPVLALDRVWVEPASALLSVHAVSSPLAQWASDHLPVRARIDPRRLWTPAQAAAQVTVEGAAGPVSLGALARDA